MGFLGGTIIKNPPSSVGDVTYMGSVPGWGRSSGVANGNPLQYRLENSMDRGVWWVLQSMGTQKIGSTECTLTGCRA